jgi:hypothetical protein
MAGSYSRRYAGRQVGMHSDWKAGSPADRQERRQVDKQDWRQVGWHEEDRKIAGETEKHAERRPGMLK